jgi:hypothetical protein
MTIGFAICERGVLVAQVQLRDLRTRRARCAGAATREEGQPVLEYTRSEQKLKRDNRSFLALHRRCDSVAAEVDAAVG